MAKTKPHKIVLYQDFESSMEKLVVDRHCCGEGDDWDYHISRAMGVIIDLLDHLEVPYTFERKRYKYKC